MVTQDLKDHTIVQLEPTCVLEESSPICTTERALLLASISQEPMLRSCQVSGNFRSDHALEFQLVIIFGWRAIFSKELQKTSMSMFPSHQSFSQNGMDRVATLTSLQRP